MIEKLKSWLKKNPPADMPYWPGAMYTTPFGIRTSQEIIDDPRCNPAHLATDRARGKIKNLKMPFDGTVRWEKVGGVAGSLLRIISDDLLLEIQVMHTELTGPLKKHYNKGDDLPVEPGRMGIAATYGRHAHTEILMPYDSSVMKWVREQSIEVNTMAYIEAHCAKYDLTDPEKLKEKINRQMDTWGILELYTHFAVRDFRDIPSYRTPHFGRVNTIFIDSKWLLKI